MLQEILDRIQNAEDFSNETIKIICEEFECFFDRRKNLFNVSFKKDIQPEEFSFNTASCVIGRIFASFSNEKHFINKYKPLLYDKLDLLKFNYENTNDYCNLFPLNSFGILPSFSVTHLARYFCSVKIKNEAFRLSFLRILKILNTNLDNHSKNIIPEMHPYLLHNYYRVLMHVKLTLMETKDFFDEINNCFLDLKNGKGSFLELRNRIGGEDVIEKYFSEKTDRNEIELLLNHIEHIAKYNALTQIESAGNSKNADFDPSSLIYSILTLDLVKDPKYKKLILHGLKIILEKMEPSGVWRPVLPYHVDLKARAIYVTSFQIAKAATFLFAEYANELYSQYDDLIAFSEKFNNWLTEHKIEVPISNNKIVGWCSDDAPDWERIDVWVTIHTLNYCMQQLRLLENIKKILVLKKYTFKKKKALHKKEKINIENNFYFNIVDVDSNKENIELEYFKNIFNSCAKNEDADVAPVFLLYGPPGTSKTTLADTIATYMGWEILSLSPSDFVSGGIEKIETKSRRIFSHLKKLHKTVIVLDEMDSLLRERTNDKIMPGAMIDFIIPAFLPKLQDLRDYSIKHQMAVFLITNYYGNIDRAISREGRIDKQLLVLPLTFKQRVSFINKQLLERFKNNYSNEDAEKIVNVFDTGIHTMLLKNPLSQLLVYRENMNLIAAIHININLCLEKIKDNPIQEKIELLKTKSSDILNNITYKPKAIPSSFYDPEKNTNSKEEFGHVIKHITNINEGKNVVIPEDWKVMQKRWKKKK